jgi:hypothetical protein
MVFLDLACSTLMVCLTNLEMLPTDIFIGDMWKYVVPAYVVFISTHRRAVLDFIAA